MVHIRHLGFTVVEVLIVAVVLGILAGLTIVGYNGVRLAAQRAAAQADLRTAQVAMQLAYQETGEYPVELPDTVRTANSSGPEGASSSGVELIMRWSGTTTSYGALSPVQNGVLLSTICQDLLDEGFGRGVNQGGSTQNYITGCGNWNRGSVQITGWNTRVWNTPVQSEQLLNYANTFTTSDSWNAVHATVVKNFYTELVERHTNSGGTFPVTSFWDSWANAHNGGVIKEELPLEPITRTGYCLEALIGNPASAVWHIDETGALSEGACSTES